MKISAQQGQSEGVGMQHDDDQSILNSLGIESVDDVREEQVPQLLGLLSQSTDEATLRVLTQLARNLDLMLSLVNHAEVAYATSLETNDRELERLHSACQDVRDWIKAISKKDLSDELVIELVGLMRHTLDVDKQAAQASQSFLERLNRSRQVESGLKIVGIILVFSAQAWIVRGTSGGGPTLKA
jgi:hypothetical protein